jgi:hypothetical protein
MHDSVIMLRELHTRCVPRLVAWGPYLYTNLDASEPDEQAVIDAARSRRPASVLRKA